MAQNNDNFIMFILSMNLTGHSEDGLSLCHGIQALTGNTRKTGADMMAGSWNPLKSSFTHIWCLAGNLERVGLAPGDSSVAWLPYSLAA